MSTCCASGSSTENGCFCAWTCLRYLSLTQSSSDASLCCFTCSMPFTVFFWYSANDTPAIEHDVHSAVHFGTFGFILVRLASFWYVWLHFGSFGFIWVHLGNIFRNFYLNLTWTYRGLVMCTSYLSHRRYHLSSTTPNQIETVYRAMAVSIYYKLTPDQT